MSRLRVGAISYLNVLPLLGGFESGALCPDLEWHRGVPTALNRKLAEGELDISLVSAEAYLDDLDRYQLLPNACIAAYERVLSVRLYLRGDIRSLDGQPLGLSTQSASSRALLKILCQRFWKVQPIWQDLPLGGELRAGQALPALMLIGDQCLENIELPGYQSIDLAQAWTYATGTTFVFAVLAARKELAPAALDPFLGALGASRRWGSLHPEGLIRLAQERSQLPEHTLHDYFCTLRYEFGPSEQRGLETFASLREDL